MKIVINKKISGIHWSAFVAAGLCFLAAGQVYNQYKEVKILIEEGLVYPAMVTEKAGSCTEYSRGGNHIKVHIPAQNREVFLKIDYETCITANLGDTIMIRCSDTIQKVIKYNPGVKTAGNGNLYMAILGFLIGSSFLIFKSRNN